MKIRVLHWATSIELEVVPCRGDAMPGFFIRVPEPPCWSHDVACVFPTALSALCASLAAQAISASAVRAISYVVSLILVHPPPLDHEDFSVSIRVGL
jgi:hypothetical protein